MRTEDFDQSWHELSQEVLTGMKEWRLQHPKATFREIEAAIDERLGRLRAKMLQDAALASAAADWADVAVEEQPLCPQCGQPLEPRGQEERYLHVHGGREVALERSYGVCPACGAGFFPLDEELALLPGNLSPHLQEQLVRLGTWMPFARAAEMFADFVGVVVSESTARRQTEKAGAAYVAIQTAEVERMEEELPPAPPGPQKMLLSVDGAMVPLVHGEWAEVKTLVIGEIGEPVPDQKTGEWVVPSEKLSYFSRLADADTFGRLALVETHRRGVEKAGKVAAVTDGAEWEQGFIDLHCPKAVRILDFPHGAERISQMGQAVWGEGRPETKQWLAAQLHRLKHEGPSPVLDELGMLVRDRPGIPLLAESLAYLEKRQEHMKYAEYQAQGLPIGSGANESGNKLVVEARLKGAGMHWARPHVDPMVGLRDVVCSDRWDEAWLQITGHLRQENAQRRFKQQEKHRTAKATVLEANQVLALPTSQPMALKAPPSSNASTLVLSASLLARLASQGRQRPAEPMAVTAVPQAHTEHTGEKEPYRPPLDHPWRRPLLRRPKWQSSGSSPPAKL
jgi:YgiT-type zinc finger domain-containing protein